MSYLDESNAAPPRAGMSGCAKTFLIAFVVFLLLLVAAVIAIVVYHRQMVGAGMKWVAMNIVESLPLPAEDIAEGKLVVGDLVDAWAAERLSMAELGMSLESLKDNPNVLALTLSALAFDDIKTWNDPTATTPAPGSPLGQSELTPDERERFIAAAHRFVAAAELGSVTGEVYDEFWNTLKPEGGGQQTITSLQLRRVLLLMEQAARDTDAPARDQSHPTQGIADVMAELKALRDRV